MSHNSENEEYTDEFFRYTVKNSETSPQYTVVCVTIYDQKMFFVVTPYDNHNNIIYQPTNNQIDSLIDEIKDGNVNINRFKHTFFDIGKTDMLLSLIEK